MANNEVIDEQKQKEDYERLMSAKKLTEITGELSPLQTAQLKFWPRLISVNVTGCDTHFNFEQREFTFEIEIDEKDKRELERAKSQASSLELFCQEIFGDKYLVRVKFNGKTVFRGVRKEYFNPKADQDSKDFVSYAKKEYKKNKRFIK